MDSLTLNATNCLVLKPQKDPLASKQVLKQRPSSAMAQTTRAQKARKNSRAETDAISMPSLVSDDAQRALQQAIGLPLTCKSRPLQVRTLPPVLAAAAWLISSYGDACAAD